MWEAPAAREDVRYRGWPTKLCARIWRARASGEHEHLESTTIWRARWSGEHDDLESTTIWRAGRSGERKRIWMYMVWMTISWEAYKIDTGSYMIGHHWRLWYREQKPLSTLRSQPHFNRAAWVRMTTETASKAATMIIAGLGLQSCSRGIGKARALAHLNVWWVWPVTGMLTR